MLVKRLDGWEQTGWRSAVTENIVVNPAAKNGNSEFTAISPQLIFRIVPTEYGWFNLHSHAVIPSVSSVIHAHGISNLSTFVIVDFFSKFVHIEAVH